MSSEPTSLADMRREIDSIDDSMHDLLMRRAGLVDDIRRLKQDDADGFYRPKREAEVLRRLIGRHRGGFPKSVVIRIWREMMGALLCLQGPFAVALWAPPGSADYGRVARDHFGSATPITPYRSARAAISAINEGAASVAVLPYPEKGESDPWWPLLAADGTRRVNVLGRLPFVMPETAGEAEPAALVLGGATPEQTGSDNSVLLIDTAGTLSTMSIAGALTDAGLAPQHFDSWTGDEHPRATLLLADVADFVADDDVRLRRFSEAVGDAVNSIVIAGAYARPLGAAELAGVPGGENQATP